MQGFLPFVQYVAASVLVSLALSMALGCNRAENPRLRHVILVTIDTLRADHIGLYGYARPTTPNIDALAPSSVVFENAVPTCPATAPSVATMLTGLHRASHGVRRNRSVLPNDVETLAEVLKARGYHTAAVIDSSVIGHKGRGFDQGFGEFAFPPSTERAQAGGGRGAGRGGPAVVRKADQILANRGTAPLFLWLHLINPHGPYRAPDKYQVLFDPAEYRKPGEAALPMSTTNYGLGVLPRYQRFRGQRFPAEFRARYDAEIRSTDDNIGAIVRLLQEEDLWEDSLFVLTADHGESLGEHNYYFQHGWFVYDSSLRVPLLIRAPGLLPGGRRVAGTVSLVDLTPTILDLLGLRTSAKVEGRSLLPVIRGEEGDRPAFAQTYYGNRLTALRIGNMKYILTPPARENGPVDGWRKYWPTAKREELYDLADDPGEKHNLIQVRSGIAADFRRRVRTWLSDQRLRQQKRPAGVDIVVDRALEEQLRALGYVE